MRLLFMEEPSHINLTHQTSTLNTCHQEKFLNLSLQKS